MLSNLCRLRSVILPTLSTNKIYKLKISTNFLRLLATPAKTETKNSSPQKQETSKPSNDKKSNKPEIKHVTGISTPGHPNLWKKRKPNPYSVKLNASKLERIYSKIDHYRGMLKRRKHKSFSSLISLAANKQKVKLIRPPNPAVDYHVARGDLVEVKFLGEAYLVQTFTGICLEKRNKGIMSSILLANSEFGLHQRFYLYSPTIGQIKILQRREPFPVRKERKKPWANRI